MEKRLLYLYLKNLKKQNESAWKKVIKLPKGIRAQLLTSLFLLIVAIVFIILSSVEVIAVDYWKNICVIAYTLLTTVSLILCFTSMSSIGKYEIFISDDSMNDFWIRCKENKKWIMKELSLTNNNVETEVDSIKQRIEAYRNDIIAESDKKAERTDKWLQALAVPFVLAIITAIIDKNDNMINAISIVFAILIICFGFYGVFLLVNNVLNLFRRQKTEQLKLFIDELQGIIDFCHYYND